MILDIYSLFPFGKICKKTQKKKENCTNHSEELNSVLIINWGDYIKKAKSGLIKERGMCLLTDQYELTMANGYITLDRNETATFELFIRKLPENRSYMIAAGLEQAINYIQNLKFDDENINFLKKNNDFSDEFYDYLKDFKFSGDVYAIEEGTPIFANEPLLRVTAPIAEAQVLESCLLAIISHQTTIASKASRIVNAAKGRPCIEFGLRRAHGREAALSGARASYIAGFTKSSNVLADKEYGIKATGTMAHSWIMSYPNEEDAFRDYVKVYHDNGILLIDTYDTVEGAKTAAKVAKELEKKEHKLAGVRLDSGDLTALSIEVRKILDEADLNYIKIFASSDLNEYKIEKMLDEGAQIDAFGVGSENIVSKDCPSGSFVYKLVEATENGELKPKIKLSNGKPMYPGKKQVWRISDEIRSCYDMYIYDILATADEEIDENRDFIEPLLKPIFIKGELVYKLPELDKIRERCLKNVAMLDRIYKEINEVHTYPVVISDKLEKLVEKLKDEYTKK